LTQTKPIDTKALIEEATTSRDKETYKPLEKTPSYRIGVGARTDSTDVTFFFIEVLIALTVETCEVDILRLEKMLNCLKMLQVKGYALAFEDGNFVSCEKKSVQDPNEEYNIIKLTLKTAFS
jgi:hypothetical protein